MALIIAVVFGYKYFSGASLEGRFTADRVSGLNGKITTGTSSSEKVLMSVDTAGSGAVTLTKGSTSKYVVGKWKVTYKDNSRACQVSFGISYNGDVKKLYGSSSQNEKFINNTQLAVLAGDTVGTFSANDVSLSEFTPDFTPESGKTYTFYLYGYAPSDAGTLSKGESYMTSACVRPSGGGYEVWDSKNSNGQNAYFSVETDSTSFGIPGGIKISIQ